MTDGQASPAPRNDIVLSGEAQTLVVPFAADVAGTGAPETVAVARGADVRFAANTDDAVALPGALADYTFSAAGNTLVAEGPDGTVARIGLNAPAALRFDDGTATARLDVTDGRPAVMLGGESVANGVDAANVALATPSPGGGSGASRRPNDIFLNGADQTLRVPFNADVTGTAAAETVQIASGAAVNFSAGDGDRVALAGELDSYDVASRGNQLVLENGGTRAAIGLNGEATLAFADGSASASIAVTDGAAAVTLGGRTVDSGFDAGSVSLDADGAADNAPGTQDGGLPPVPAATGRGLVHTGTPAADLIEGNQDGGTIAGNGGSDRFVFDNDPTGVTITDFAVDDQLFLTGGRTAADISIGNGDRADGDVQVFAGENTQVTLSNIDPARDDAVSDLASFRDVFGERALGFGQADSDLAATPDATAPLELSFDAETSGFFDGHREGLTDALQEAWSAWQAHLDAAEGADVEIELRETGPDQVGNALAATQSIVSPDVPSVPTGDLFNGREARLPGVVSELRTGADPNGDAPDIVMGLQESSFDRIAFERQADGTVPDGQFDGLTVLIHELGHALGFDGSINVGPDRADGVASTFDQHISTNRFTGGFEFDGPAVWAVNNGPVIFGPSDPYHIGGDDDLMVGQIDPNETREISQVDLAILADAGVPVSDSALPASVSDPLAVA
ncbi:hypothetical protein SAMN05216241_10661 [Limimonas halophila]|uniref:Uncharacterized protein n=1 Tax=Limimonas halophila TaxID=1082479 RepID=A0A1G7RZE9_9PROT|nr:hypothetical protein [Limimonas halophila]SDG16155.1 hypothetical protein SAMN05216241_10661 [Limimonas halophila]